MEPRLITQLLDQYLQRQSASVKLRIRVYLALRSAILDGELPAGTKLPPTRVLAEDLAIGRNTGVHAYEQLTAEGYIEARVGDGSYVSDAVTRRPKHEAPKRLLGARREGLSRRGGSIANNAGSSIAQRGAFTPGVPDVELFPFHIWRRLVGKYLDVSHAHLLQYAHAGYGPLKVTLANYLRVTRMMPVDPKQVIIINGSHQALDLCARMLADHGDRAWIEDPGYWGARNVLTAAGLQLTPIPLDDKGMAPTPEDWAKPPRLVFVSPSSQYPTGTVLTLERRLELLEQADQAGAWIIEDDYDNELHFSDRPLASLFGLASRQRVIYMGTLSKVMFPGIRLAYLVVPTDLVDAFTIGNAELYRGGRLAEQAALAEFIEEGHFTAHIKRMRGIYGERREVLLDAMQRHLGDTVTTTAGHAGLQLVYRFQQPVDDTMVVAQSLAEGVVCRPLSMYYLDQARRQPGLNLGFAAVPTERIGPAARTLATVIERELQRR
ncbi:PLP-dependent aminotransferase family protein [Aquabacterium sp.]|jgi:GntR family transcriptional regulator/MocR family aminotransferase|uniref:MocR-like pyridoxine biosynthesis transcription factor PdxR n=1 Tax=Aquabacterium sp. TaxID=1872578 RepID=UPI0025C50FDF|nr:PLP-dependent aminotransferase family protein [Aquabacterium sp.]